MSGTQPPTGLPAPSRRGLRRLNRTPLYIGVGAIAGIVGMGWYVIHSGPGNGPNVSAVLAEDREGNASEVLSHAPSGIIPAMLETQPASRPAPPPPPPPAPLAPTAAKPQPGPTETEMEIAIRRKAWESYGQARDDQYKRLMALQIAGLSGDTIPTAAAASTDSGAPPPATRGSAAAGGAAGWGGSSDQKADFWGSRQNPDYQQDIVTQPVSDYEVKAGDVITAVLVNGLNSDSKGMIKAQVTKNVLDHATGLHILIPQGATLIGYYNTDIGYGQTRLEAGFDRVIFPPPGDESLRLVRTPGSDVEGYAGLHDITENHLGRIIQNALLAAAFSAGIQLSQPSGNAFSSYSTGQIAASAVGQQANAVGSEFIRRGLNIPPTQVVRNGTPFTILVKEDIAFSRPWQPTPLPSDPIRLISAQQ